MRRREFIAFVGSTAVAWPLMARAQQPGMMRRIGVLTGFAENEPEAQRRIAAFMQGLAELGWTNGRNVRVDFRWGSANPDLIRGYAEEMVRLQPEVILVNSSSVLKFVQQTTHSIPIVFVQVNDPVGSGMVASLAHPGGNVTGFTPAEFSLGGKQLETLKEIAPEVSQVAVMTDLGSPPLIGMQRSIEIAAATLGVRVVTAAVHDAGEIERATESFAREANGGLIVLANPISNVNRALIIELAAKQRLPAIYSYRYFVTDGGLASYGIDPADQYRQAAAYIDRILKGAKPADLPVQQPTKYDLVINLKTAKTLGLTIPESFLSRADEVIE